MDQGPPPGQTNRIKHKPLESSSMEGVSGAGVLCKDNRRLNSSSPGASSNLSGPLEPYNAPMRAPAWVLVEDEPYGDGA